ncbi:MAG: hemolysin III family protein [Candidatus Hydrogenedens sp.]|nr:hemolysin III family protein [Candidatus Hydrogenedentota bacterium]NLF58768.1 hemolysin III family protein [Candidatus Hydrogenedens sp.]
MSEKHYSLREEIANALTHGIGALLSLIGLVVMVLLAVWSGDPWKIVSASVFGGSMIALYLASTLYHAVPVPKLKHFFRKLDHSAIYLLIAGTYTPFLLVSMRGAWGWSLFGVLWGVAVVGCAFKAFFVGKWDKLSTALYLAMGWAVLVALKPAIEAVPVGGMVLMALGGLAYSVGVFFYVSDRIPFNHAIWHGFVLAGTAFHYFGVVFYVLLWPSV